MDLFVLGTIVVVFLVLLAASLLVNKMPSGKTFEEVQREKKLLADQMKQQSRPAKQKGGTTTSAGNKAGKGGKANTGGQEKKGKKKVVEEEKVPAVEAHVEFAEEEIYLSEDMPVVKKSLSATGLNKANNKKSPTESKKNNKANKDKSASTGILVNKHEQPAGKAQEQVVAEANHFEEIHPKDDVEMLRAHKDEPNKGGKPQKNAANELRKEKKAKKPTPSQSKSTPNFPSELEGIEGVAEIIKANEQKLQKSARNMDAVDSVRNKRATRTDNSLQALQKMVEGTDEISVNVLIMLLAKAELSRPEIQIVIDYLLNKQSDSGAVIKSEWTEGKQDLVARLKKQLAERDVQVQNEQEAAAAFQEKLKLLRLELNTEKSQNAHTAKMYMWEMAQKEKDMEVLAAKVNGASAEKAALLAQMQKMQVTLVQQKNAMGAQEEHQRQLQQLQEANATMQRELEMYKNTVQVGKVDLRNLENELDSARNEIIQLHQKSFEVSEQMNRDVQVLSGQVSALKVEVANYENKVANYESLLADKKAAVEQYEAEKGQNKGTEEKLFRQLEEQKQAMSALQAERASQQKEAGGNYDALLTKYESLVADKKALVERFEAEKGENKGAEESLAKQLEEVRREVESYKQVAAEKTEQLAKIEAERKESKEAEQDFVRQLEEQKQKNNDLRTTNWKLMEAMTAAEKAVTANVNNENKIKKDLEVLMKEKVAEAEKELRDKFTHMLTQISVFSNLKLDNGSALKSSTSNGDSNGTSTADLDAWMSRVAEGVKKKLDVYESLLGALKQQLQDKREKEMMSVTSGKGGLKNGRNTPTETKETTNGNGTTTTAST